MALVSPVLVYADACKHQKDIEFVVDASTVSTLFVDVGAGDIEIIGADNSNEVLVKGRACASAERLLDDLDLLQKSQGSEATIYTENKNRPFRIFSWGFGYKYIDISLTVPSGLALDVEDGSGAVVISGVSLLKLDDGSGSVRISNISDDVFVDDGSGPVYISDVRGLVSIDDGSGPIHISDVRGLVSIDDGAGDLLVTGSDDVRITHDGSGDIEIENIQGNVAIEEDGSGGIDVLNVGGNVSVGDSGSGSVNVNHVAGTTNIK